MNILYDDAAFNQPYGGVTKYFVELIKNLPSDCRAELCQRTTQNYALQAVPFNIPAATHTQWNFWPWLNMRGKWMIYRLLAQTLRIVPSCEYENRRLFVEKLNSGGFDILHITDPHKYTFEWECIIGKKPVVMTVHDLIPDMDPKKAKIRRNRAKALRLVDHIIAVSENTKRDVIRMYGIDPEKISVVYHGAGEKRVLEDGDQRFDGFESSRLMAKFKEKIGSLRPYLLYVGGRRGYKNFAFFAKVVAQMLKEYPALHLVCAGERLSADEMRPFADLCVEDRVWSQYVEDINFPSLYVNAVALIYPSRYEGFGMPIVDAFKAGCPVVLSRSSCFPEIGGDAALYFDVDSADELANCIRNVLEHDDVRQRLVAAGNARVSDFTWSRCAEETVAIYRKVIG